MEFNQAVIVPEFVQNARKALALKSMNRKLEEGEGIYDSINVNQIVDITLA